MAKKNEPTVWKYVGNGAYTEQTEQPVVAEEQQ